MIVEFKLMSSTAKVPTRAYERASGWDCYYDGDPVMLIPGKICRAKLGIAIAIPVGYEAQIRPRSGLTDLGLLVHIGTIDSDYRGEISAIVQNVTRDKVLSIRPDMRICQLVFARVPPSIFVEATTLSTTLRGDRGFGSSG